jgi:hypothetical protein
MATKFKKSESSNVRGVARAGVKTRSKPVGRGRKQGHSKPLPLTISLHQPGRLRVGHLMNLLSISHATLYARLLTGAIPKPDGKDGKRPFWKTSTVRSLLEGH